MVDCSANRYFDRAVKTRYIFCCYLFVSGWWLQRPTREDTFAAMTSVLRIFNKGRSDKIDYIDSILSDERPSNEEINKQFDVLLVCVFTELPSFYRIVSITKANTTILINKLHKERARRCGSQKGGDAAMAFIQEVGLD